MSAAIVFATDDAFAPFAKGLVLSLENSTSKTLLSLCMIDIGCSPATTSWMKAHGVQVRGFDRNDFYERVDPGYKSYRDAQFCRPLLPILFPGYGIYVWCDADTWIQDIRSINLIAGVAAAAAGQMAIVPFIDYSYDFIYNDFAIFVRQARSWYANTYNQEVANKFAKRTVLSSGIFGCSANSPLWSLWRKELTKLIARPFDCAVASHLAEQTALNLILYRTGAFVPLEATHNYNCHVGCAKRNAKTGRVLINIPPYREIGIVHLSYCSRQVERYLTEGLFYNSGKYLSPSEITTLRKLGHHHGDDEKAVPPAETSIAITAALP